MNRRQFLQLGLMSLASTIVSACALSTPAPPASPTSSTPAPATPIATRPPLRGDVTPGNLLRNENVPGFYVRFIEEFPALDPGKWQLQIKGLIEAPTTMTLEHIKGNLPFVEQNTRMKCVECWSARAVWGGFTYAALAQLVKPKPEATHLYFACEDGYYEVLRISELQKERALFVTHMDGQPLGAKYGAPLRMIIPWLYGYKGAKTINTVIFSNEDIRGFWSTVGPYSVDGVIMPGLDRPLDLPGGQRAISGGEIRDY